MIVYDVGMLNSAIKENVRRGLPVLLAAVSILTSTGCVGTARLYRGPGLPRNEIALVRNPERLQIIAVNDAMPTRIRPFKRKYVSVHRLEFLPGKQEIIVVRDIPKGAYQGVHAVTRTSVRKERLRFEAKPGSTFVIGEDLQTTPEWKWTPWIKEQTAQGLVLVEQNPPEEPKKK